MKRWPERPGRLFAVAFAVALAAAGVERGVALLRAGTTEPGLGARWIWAPGVHRERRPVAFYAVRDVELSEESPAWLSIVADEGYVLYVNGQRAGSDSYRHGMAADLYPVGDYLRAGWNRIAVRLHSQRGAGGLLASLRLGKPDRVVLRTDAEWRIFRHWEPGILRGWRLAEGEPAQVWRRPPTGRWRLARESRERPVLPLELRPWPLRAVRVRRAGLAPPWIDLASRSRMPELGSRLLVDWGEELTGYLALELPPSTTVAGRVCFGSQPEAIRPTGDCEPIIPIPDRRWWEAIHPRTFRYALVAGTELRAVPVVRQVDVTLAERLGCPRWEPAGAFGFPPPEP